MTCSPTAAHDGPKGYTTYARFYDSRIELTIRSEAVEETGTPGGDRGWQELLLDLKQRGLTKPPTLAVGDGALGFWAALREVYLSVEKAFHGLFPLGQHPKTPRVFGVAVRRILRRQTLSTVC